MHKPLLFWQLSINGERNGVSIPGEMNDAHQQCEAEYPGLGRW